ncbi:MAG TPA: putative zinc-binding metallopeptidase [Ferruginibacter sp.]|nr:putative zinc-binding metallopeptidase [Ferruginibacter sp.]HPH89486.1 putative zinc-binding metallopeptidase [Ferruginibacter sp.]
MKFIKSGFTIIAASLLLLNCTKEEPLPPLDDISGLGGDTWVPTAIDKWIYDSLTKPYNISIKYKWELGEVDLNRTLVPPREEQIIPVLTAIKKVWIDTYLSEAGPLFLKNIAPKFFILVGSPAYNGDGSIKLGTAEGGRKVVLYDINNFRVKGMPGYNPNTDTAGVLEQFHTIQHEFAHILDQNVRVPIAFSSSSANSYTSDWLNVTDEDAKNNGFISPYGNSSRDEDWAEMVGFQLVSGRGYFDGYVNSIDPANVSETGITGAQAQQRLRSKEATVVQYFDQAWNIDFRQLQTKTRDAINSILY